MIFFFFFFFFQAEDGIRDLYVTGVQTCALPIYQYADGAHHPTLQRETSPICPAADAVEVRATSGAVAVIRGVVALAVIAEPVGARETQRESQAPAVPIRRRLRVDGERVAALGARADVQRDAAEIRLRPLGEPHRTRPVVMAGEPESVDRAVVKERVEVVDPGLPLVRLALRRKRRCQHNGEREGQACENKEAVSRSLASVPSCAA